MARGGTRQVSPVCAYVAERTGSSLSGQQVSRLTELLEEKRASRNQPEEQYLEFLKTPHGAAELAELMSVISVHKTDLFRDEVQLQAFRENVLKPLAATKQTVRLWSAGCATGEEVATLLILLDEVGANPASTVLGTDISESALRQARALTFQAETLRRVPAKVRARYFRASAQGFTLEKALAERATFVRHNLMDLPYPSAPGGGKFDVIFCRNVLIYFTDAAFDRVAASLAEQLVPEGCLVLSAAEPILRVQPMLTTVRCAQAFFYRRRKPGAPVEPPLIPPPAAPRKRTPTGEVPLATVPPPATPPHGLPVAVPAEEPREEAVRTFQLILDWAAAGESDTQTEQGLRRCLYLDPHFAQARYLLAMLLEQRGARADASGEYRRALATLNEGKSRPTPFFLNDERLKVACALAVKRLGFSK